MAAETKGGDSQMCLVEFITTEQEADLIVSFAITGDLPWGILSLTLLRTPKYEFILEPEERGVNVSWEEDDDKSELLLALDRSGDEIRLTTTTRKFTLDVTRVDDSHLRRAYKVLQKMNFDGAIRLTWI